MTAMTEAYLKDPIAIYKASFAAIEREIDLSDIPDDLHAIVNVFSNVISKTIIYDNSVIITILGLLKKFRPCSYHAPLLIF